MTKLFGMQSRSYLFLYKLFEKVIPSYYMRKFNKLMLHQFYEI